MSNGEDNVRVTYGVKELLGEINKKLASIDNKLDTKVDVGEFKILAERVESNSRRIDALDNNFSQRLAIERAEREQRTVLFTGREKMLGLMLAGLAVVMQFASHLHFPKFGG